MDAIFSAMCIHVARISGFSEHLPAHQPLAEHYCSFLRWLWIYLP